MQAVGINFPMPCVIGLNLESLTLSLSIKPNRVINIIFVLWVPKSMARVSTETWVCDLAEGNFH